MELRQLEYFVELCRVRNFTKASENLHVAQPAVTKAIQKLEEELGAQLIIRSQKPLGLTPAGERFYTRIDDILRQLEDAAAEAADGTNLHRALSIGISPMAGILFIDMLTDEDAVAQGVFYNIITRSSIENADRLLRRELDLGLLIRRNLPPELAFVPLETQEALCLLPYGHHLLKKKVLTFEDLRGETFTMELEHNKSTISELVRERCIAAGFTPPKPPFVQDYHPNTRLSAEWIRRGYGIGFMPEHAARQAKGVVLRGIEPPVSFEIGLAYRKDTKLPVQMKKLIAYILERYPAYAKQVRQNSQK